MNNFGQVSRNVHQMSLIDQIVNCKLKPFFSLFLFYLILTMRVRYKMKMRRKTGFTRAVQVVKNARSVSTFQYQETDDR